MAMDRKWMLRALGMMVWVLALSTRSFAQQQQADSVRYQKVWGLRGHLGFIIIHSPALNTIRRSYPWGLEADWGRQFVSQKAWDFCNCYPRAGVATTLWDWGNRPVLGYGVTAVAYVEPIFMTKHRINLGIRMGGGLAWMSRPYDADENPDNQAYSTRINFPLIVNATLYGRINPFWSVRLAGNFNHVSNGGLRLPNKGINYPTLGLGVDYAPSGINFKERAKNREHGLPDPRVRFNLGALATFKNGGLGSTDQYGVWGFFGGMVGYLGRWSGLNAGFEWVWDNARRARMDYWGRPENHSRAAILAGHQFLLGRVVFSQQLGLYVYDQWRENNPVYQRFGLSVMLADHISMGVNLKTHLHVADFLDARLAFEF
jgi:hypothetical protein